MIIPTHITNKFSPRQVTSNLYKCEHTHKKKQDLEISVTFTVYVLIPIIGPAQNSKATKHQGCPLLWERERESACQDQSEACINPMCQSGKNQAQLGSRTVERGNKCETGMCRAFEDEQGPKHPLYSHCICTRAHEVSDTLNLMYAFYLFEIFVWRTIYCF